MHHWKDNKGNTVYVVNRGKNGTSIPSCVNGKNVNNNCSPTGWNIGVKANEVYALRLMVSENYKKATIKPEINTFDGGRTVPAYYEYMLSDKPGDMERTSFAGLCDDRHGRVTLSSENRWLFDYCYVPNTSGVVYLNIKLKSGQDQCKSEVCSGYIILNGFTLADAFK